MADVKAVVEAAGQHFRLEVLPDCFVFPEPFAPTIAARLQSDVKRISKPSGLMDRKFLMTSRENFNVLPRLWLVVPLTGSH